MSGDGFEASPNDKMPDHDLTGDSYPHWSRSVLPLVLVIGSLAAVALFPRLHNEPVVALGRGAEDAIMPLINTAAVIGFGGVVVHTSGFGDFTHMMQDSSLPSLVSLFVASSLTSALVGSSSGGLQIFMETMSASYLAMGMEP
jgi:H+/gluconate symporter-like permease